MSQSLTTTVTDLTTSTRPKKDGSGVLEIVNVSVPELDMPISGYASQIEDNINVGDAIKIIFQEGKSKTNKRFISLVSVAKLDGLAKSAKKNEEGSMEISGTGSVGKTKPNVQKTLKQVQEEVNTNGLNNVEVMQVVKTTKDLSQEISGFMQALVQSGLYHTQKDNEFGTKSTFLNDTLLELHTNRMLDVKQKLMSERSKQ